MTRIEPQYKLILRRKGEHMALTEVFMTADELAEMTPEEFVNQIRHECMKPGRGMHNHPLVLGRSEERRVGKEACMIIL